MSEPPASGNSSAPAPRPNVTGRSSCGKFISKREKARLDDAASSHEAANAILQRRITELETALEATVPKDEYVGLESALRSAAVVQAERERESRAEKEALKKRAEDAERLFGRLQEQTAEYRKSADDELEALRAERDTAEAERDAAEVERNVALQKVERVIAARRDAIASLKEEAAREKKQLESQVGHSSLFTESMAAYL